MALNPVEMTQPVVVSRKMVRFSLTEGRPIMANQNQGQGQGQKQGQRNPVEEEKRSPSRSDQGYEPEIENPEPRHSDSRTAQDRDDVNTGGGEDRGPTKEFPR
jgi:hypothetical protein